MRVSHIILLFAILLLCTPLTWSANLQAIQEQAAANAPEKSSLRFGVCAHLQRANRGWNMDILMPMIKHLGVCSFRDSFSWSNIEKRKNIYKLTDIEKKELQMSARYDLKPLLILSYGNPIYKNPLAPKAFTKYANWLIEKLKGKVDTFEVWNEPGNFKFRKQYGGTWNAKGTNNTDSPWLKQFAQFSAYVTKKIKEVHPNVTLIGYSTPPPTTQRLFKYSAAWPYLNGLAIHTYTYKLPPEIQPYGGIKINKRDGMVSAGNNHSFASLIQHYRSGLENIGRAHMPIWITEFGYTTAKVDKKGLWRGFTEPAQAAYLVRFGILAVANGVQRVYFYDFYDDGSNPNKTEQNFGLIRHNYTPKQSYFAIQRLCSLMPGDTKACNISLKVHRHANWKWSGSMKWDGATITYLTKPQAYAVRQPDGTIVVFLWKPGRIYSDYQEELANLTIKGKADLEVVNAGRMVSGKTIKLIVKKHNKDLILKDLPYGSDPVYITLKPHK